MSDEFASANGGSYADIEDLRIELAVLQEPVPTKNPTTGKFKIPARLNDSTVSILIPNCFRIFFNDKPTIPKGTRFLVAFTGANFNDSRIVGLYDQEVYNNHFYSYYEFQKAFKIIVKRVRSLEHKHSYDGGEV